MNEGAPIENDSEIVGSNTSDNPEEEKGLNWKAKILKEIMQETLPDSGIEDWVTKNWPKIEKVSGKVFGAFVNLFKKSPKEKIEALESEETIEALVLDEEPEEEVIETPEEESPEAIVDDFETKRSQLEELTKSEIPGIAEAAFKQLREHEVKLHKEEWDQKRRTPPPLPGAVPPPLPSAEEAFKQLRELEDEEAFRLHKEKMSRNSATPPPLPRAVPPPLPNIDSSRPPVEGNRKEKILIFKAEIAGAVSAFESEINTKIDDVKKKCDYDKLITQRDSIESDTKALKENIRDAENVIGNIQTMLSSGEEVPDRAEKERLRDKLLEIRKSLHEVLADAVQENAMIEERIAEAEDEIDHWVYVKKEKDGLKKASGKEEKMESAIKKALNLNQEKLIEIFNSAASDEAKTRDLKRELNKIIRNLNQIPTKDIPKDKREMLGLTIELVNSARDVDASRADAIQAYSESIYLKLRDLVSNLK